MKIDILTIFPEMFEGPFDTSMLKKAQDDNLVEINVHNLRNWAEDNHKSVDDRPYGGGKGMILKVDVIDKAVNELKKRKTKEQVNNRSSVTNHQSLVILLDATGKKFDQKHAQKLSKINHIILIAGHYEGVDYRVHEYIADRVVSIGDYVLTGGEIPAMVVTDAVVRLIPGVLEKEAKEKETFSLTTNNRQPNTVLEYPQYTRPEEYKGWWVPDILLSGHHEKIEKWRQKKSKEITKKRRPDLLE